MNFPNYWSDEPLEQEADDLLGRGQFAKIVAKTLLSECGPKSLVVGLNGPWGSGKSTVAHFAVNRLNAHSPDLPVIWFEPWLIGSVEAFVKEFFIALGQALLTEGNTEEEKSKRSLFYKYAARIASSLSSTVQLGSVLGVQNAMQIAAALNASGQALSALSIALEPESVTPTLRDLRNEICNELRKNPKPVVVVIDDLDRLNASEIRVVFQLIRACNEFPNLRFLVLFDRAQATMALNSVAGDGEGFLEKIVHQAFDLPLVTQDQRQSYIDQCIETMNMESLGEEAKIRLDLVSQGLLVPGLTSIRRAKRFFSSASVLLQELRDDSFANVDLPDFLVLEYIRQFLPELYGALKDEELRLPGFYLNDVMYLDDEKKIRQERRQSALPVDSSLRKLAEIALQLLDAENPPFDKIAIVQRNRAHADRRFSSYQWRGVYFGFSTSYAWLKDEEWQLIKASLTPEGECNDWLTKLEESERRGDLARSIADRIVTLNLEEIRVMLRAVSRWEWGSEIAVELQEVQKSTRFVAASMLFHECLQVISVRSDIVDELKSLLDEPFTLGCVANALGEEAVNFKQGHSAGFFMNRMAFEELREMLLPRLDKAIRTDWLFRYHEPGRLLRSWRRIAGEEGYRSWIGDVILDQNRFIQYIESVLSLAVNRDRSFDWTIDPASDFFIALEAIDDRQLSEKGGFARNVVLESSRQNVEEHGAEPTEP